MDPEPNLKVEGNMVNGRLVVEWPNGEKFTLIEWRDVREPSRFKVVEFTVEHADVDD